MAEAEGQPVRQPRQTWRAGSIVEIPLAENCRAYAQLGALPVCGFLDGRFCERATVQEILRLPLLFKIWVFRSAVTRGRWLKIGSAPVRADIAHEDHFWKQDPLSGALAIYHSEYAVTNRERPARLSECVSLECAAVWEAAHVEDRLNAHYFGTENPWTPAIDVSRVPQHQRDC